MWALLVAWMWTRYITADIVHAIKGTTAPRRQRVVPHPRPGFTGFLADLKDDALRAATERRRARWEAKKTDPQPGPAQPGPGQFGPSVGPQPGPTSTNPGAQSGPGTAAGGAQPGAGQPDPQATPEPDPASTGPDGDQARAGQYTAFRCMWCQDTGGLTTRLHGKTSRMPCPWCSAGRRWTSNTTNSDYAVRDDDAPDDIPETVRATAERITRPELTASTGTTTEGNTMTTLATTDSDLDPRAAMKFSQDMEQLATMLLQKLEATTADLTSKKVTGEPIACMTKMLDAAGVLVSAAREAQGYFREHIGVQDHVESVRHVGGDDYLRPARAGK